LEKGDAAMHKFILKRALALGCMVFAFCGAAIASDPLSQMQVIKPHVRMDAPDFVLKDIEGRQKGLTDFKGKVILLNFWATWCPGCREEMPSLEKLWKEFRTKGVVVIAIAIDRNREEVKSFATDLGLTFPILLDLEGVVRKNYEITVLPMTYIIGKDGKISGRMYGDRDWAGDGADALMKNLLQ
jgi:peroxiredoxin